MTSDDLDRLRTHLIVSTEDAPPLFNTASDLLFDKFCDQFRIEPEPEEPKPTRTRQRKPTLAGVAKQATKAGVDVARYDVRPDGTISVVPGKPSEATTPDNNNDSNEWDGVLQ